MLTARKDRNASPLDTPSHGPFAGHGISISGAECGWFVLRVAPALYASLLYLGGAGIFNVSKLEWSSPTHYNSRTTMLEFASPLYTWEYLLRLHLPETKTDFRNEIFVSWKIQESFWPSPMRQRTGHIFSFWRV